MVFGIALSSFAALLLELALTRLFSVVLFYHFAFLAISIALLGLGAGGVFAHLRKDRLARFETRALVSRLCSINALIVPVVLVIVLRTPVSLEISKANFLRLTAIYLASAVPFFITGLEFSVVFARQAKHVSPALRRRSGGRGAGLPGHCPAAQLAGWTEHRVLHGRLHGGQPESSGRRTARHEDRLRDGPCSSWS